MNIRLFIEYALIVAVVLLGASTYTLFLHKNQQADKIAALQGDLKEVQHVNERQQQNIDYLKGLREIDERAVNGLYTAIERIRENKGNKDVALQILRERDKEVDNFLRMPVPAGLSGLYGRAPSADDSRNQAGQDLSPSAPVSPPAPARVPSVVPNR